MATLFTNGSGFVLAGGEDGVASTCCCGTSEPINACDGVDCGGDPSMQVTVTGASGTINWVGETWNLPADSGVTKCVCPTFYVKTKGGGGDFARHGWRYGGYPNSSLKLRRDANADLSYTDSTAINQLQLLDFTLRDVKRWNTGVPTAGSFDMSIINAVGEPTYNNYDITDAFFSSFTASGITYTWAKGNDW